MCKTRPTGLTVCDLKLATVATAIACALTVPLVVFIATGLPL